MVEALIVSILLVTACVVLGIGMIVAALVISRWMDKEAEK